MDDSEKAISCEEPKQHQDNMLSLFTQINTELTQLRQEDMDLTQQLTSLYDDLCRLRQYLTQTQSNSMSISNLTAVTIPTKSIRKDSTTMNRYPSKQRSGSEPNILTNRHRIVTRIDDLQ